MENEYRCLWDTVTKLSEKYNFGDAFPIRKTSQLFLEREKTLFRGTDNSTNESWKHDLKVLRREF